MATVTVERTPHARLAPLLSCWRDPSLVGRWLPGSSSRSLRVDFWSFDLGGQWSFFMEGLQVSGSWSRLDEQEHRAELETSWVTPNPHGGIDESRVAVRFTENSHHSTTITVEHTDLPAEAESFYDEFWRNALDMLDIAVRDVT